MSIKIPVKFLFENNIYQPTDQLFNILIYDLADMKNILSFFKQINIFK